MFVLLVWRNIILKHRYYDTANEWYLIYWSSDTSLKMPLWIQAKIMCSENNKTNSLLCFKYQISCTVQMLGSLPSLHRWQNRIASKQLFCGKAFLLVCTQIFPYFCLAQWFKLFYTIMFNHLFLKEIILIIKYATLQAGLQKRRNLPIHF